MPQIGRILSQVGVSGLPEIKLDIPLPGGLFSNGLIFGFGLVIQIVLGLFIMIWVVYAALAGLQIVRSQGSADQIAEGSKKIKYIWMSGSVLFIFFAVIALIGSILGFGLPTEWGNTLSQCGGYSGPFYFAQVDQQLDYYKSALSVDVSRNVKAYCCVYNSANNSTYDKTSPLHIDNVKKFGLQNNGGNWVLMQDDTAQPPADAGLTECVKFKG
jgi:hypothetical protein